jgi:membrane-bound lytic murein transglycosylase F
VLWPVLAVVASASVDLPQLAQRGSLKVLVFGQDEEFLPRAGSPKAHDRELLGEFCERNKLKLELVVEREFEKLFTRLASGDGDLIAHGLTITDERKQRMAFTLPVAIVKQLLIAKKGLKNPPRKPADLKERVIMVHSGSAYSQTLEALGATVSPAPQDLDSEGVVYKVGRGEFPLTVTDSNVFESIAAYNSDVVALFPIAEGKELAWALRPDAPQLKSALDAFLVEKALTAHSEKPFTGDLDAIKKRGALRLLTWNDPVSYFAHKGQLFGFDYEYAQLIAKRLKLRLEVVVPPERKLLLPWLIEGRGDFIAAQLHPVASEKRAAFSTPYLFTDEVSVGKAPKAEHRPDLSDDVELLEAGKPAIVDKLLVDSLPGTPPASEVVATQQPIAFAVRADAKKLKKSLDDAVAATYHGLEYNLLVKRYFEDNHVIEAARADDASRTGQLSPFDTLFRASAQRTGLDWRLLAAQCFQESRFDPQAKSWAGALGLFQLMPVTAQELGVHKRDDPTQSIQGGAEYDAKLLARVDAKLTLQQRLRFTLAAYNVGWGHVEDAQRLAAEQGLDATKWFGNVEKSMQLLQKPAFYRRARHGYCRGSEPVKYVSEIQTRYDHYVSLMP